MATKKQEAIDVLEVEYSNILYCVLGKTPLICNRMSNKVQQELLLPKGRKTATEKASSLKHNPIQEFRDSPYLSENDKDPAFIQHLASAFKGALQNAALDLPGAKKTQVGRLVKVEGDGENGRIDRVNIFGLPRIFSSIVRSADMNKTPDVRTRVIIPQWACFVSVSFVSPILRDPMVSRLLSMAGMTSGIGDWRPEKGKGSFGQFDLVRKDDPRFCYLIENCGREAQIEAMKTPEAYDEETSRLLSWYEVEVEKRGFKREEIWDENIRGAVSGNSGETERLAADA